MAELHNAEDAILYAACFDANAGIFEVVLNKVGLFVLFGRSYVKISKDAFMSCSLIFFSRFYNVTLSMLRHYKTIYELKIFQAFYTGSYRIFRMMQ